jgi:hypothetical protein
LTTSPSLRRFGLWVATTVLVPVFLAAGATKFVFPELWADSFANQWGIPPSLVEVAGAMEILGAILLLPRRTAFLGGLLIAPVMAMATTTHLMHRQWALAGVTLVLCLMAAWVAAGRQHAADEERAESEPGTVDVTPDHDPGETLDAEGTGEPGDGEVAAAGQHAPEPVADHDSERRAAHEKLAPDSVDTPLPFG